MPKRRAKNGKRKHWYSPPRQAGEREPSGRLSRRAEHVREREEMTEAEAKSVVIEARVRHGIPRHLADLSDAGRPNAGTVHGIMRLRNELDQDQWSAAEWFLGRRAAYLRAVAAPGRPIEPVEAAVGEDDAADWARAAIGRYHEVLDCIRDVSSQVRAPVISAFDVILVRQQYLPHLVGDLRIGLNAVHRVFLAGQRQAA